MTLYTICDTESGELELEIEVLFHPPVPGETLGPPELCRPPEGGYVQVLHIRNVATGKALTQVPLGFPTPETLYRQAEAEFRRADPNFFEVPR